MFFENFPEVKSTGRTGPARDFSARAGVYPEGSKIEAESGGGFLGAVSPAVRAWNSRENACIADINVVSFTTHSYL